MMCKKSEYTRYCKQCEDYFKTNAKFSEMCEECKEKNHEYRRLKNLNLLQIS